MQQWPRLHPHRQRHVERLRIAGRCVFAAAVAVAIVVYRIGVLNREPTVAELMPRTAAIIERQRGILFGRTGAAMMEWFDALHQPAGHAALIVIAGLIAAAALYQVAHVIEIEEGR